MIAYCIILCVPSQKLYIHCVLSSLLCWFVSK
nr:MAG TPA: hypothetical protein [Caudoviricetes sp.]